MLNISSKYSNCKIFKLHYVKLTLGYVKNSTQNFKENLSGPVLRKCVLLRTEILLKEIYKYNVLVSVSYYRDIMSQKHWYSIHCNNRV